MAAKRGRRAESRHARESAGAGIRRQRALFAHRVSLGFSGPEEIREFLPDMDDEMFAKLHIPAYTAERISRRPAAWLPRDGSAQRTVRGLGERNPPPAIHWMREVGIKWDIDSYVIIDGKYYFEPGMVIHPRGGVEGRAGPAHAVARDRHEDGH